MKTLILCALAALAFFIPAAHAAETGVEGAKRFLDIREIRSPGGITAWFLEDKSVPVLSIEFAFAGAGTVLDPDDRQGLARLVSNTLDEGAGDMDSQTFQRAMSDHSIALHFDVGRDDFYGSLKTLTRHRAVAADLMRLALSTPRFDEDAIARMKAANISRIRSQLSDPDWIAARIMNDVGYEGHAYARNSGGTIRGIESVTADDLRAFAKTHFGRNNLRVAVAGDITEDELKTLLDTIFSGLPETAAIPAVADTAIRNGGTTTLYDKDTPQTSIQIMQPGLGRKDPDYPALALMNYILGSSGFGSRLTEEIREKRGLTYGIYSGLSTLDHANAITISTSTRNEKAGEVLGLIQAEWEKMRNTRVTDAELKAAKDYIIGSMPLALTSTDNIAGMILGLRLDDLPIDYLDHVNERYNAVTVDDVARVAGKILTPDQLSIVMVGRPVGVTPTKTMDTIPNVE